MGSRIDMAVRSLQGAITDGHYRAGERLPPERELARQLGISRSSLRKALEELEARGQIWRHVGRGTFVSDAPADVLVASLRLSPPPGPADYLEACLMIEPAVAAMAAVRATMPEIVRLRALVADRATGANGDPVARYEEVDRAFHAGVAAATRNPLVAGLGETLDVLRRQNEWIMLRRSALTPDNLRTFAHQHRGIAERIARRDPRGARLEMQRHLTSVQEAMIGQVPEMMAPMTAEHIVEGTHAD